jgi:hypothetical protein
MKRIAVWVSVLFIAALGQSALARDCDFVEGEARWKIKTSVPAGALKQKVKRIDLRALVDLKNPKLTAVQKKAIASKLWPQDVTVGNASLQEGDIVSVEGFLYRSRCQKDGDYHFEIGTSSTTGKSCFIVEVPDPGQVRDRALRDLVKQVRQKLDGFPSGIFNGKSAPLPVKVTGQFFLDSQHLRRDNPKTGKKADPSGGRGTKFNGKNCATNVWEIHPVTDLVRRSSRVRS